MFWYFKENVGFDVEQPSRLWRHRRQLDGARRDDVISRTVGQFCQILCSGFKVNYFITFFQNYKKVGHGLKNDKICRSTQFKNVYAFFEFLSRWYNSRKKGNWYWLLYVCCNYYVRTLTVSFLAIPTYFSIFLLSDCSCIFIFVFDLGWHCAGAVLERVHSGGVCVWFIISH